MAKLKGILKIQGTLDELTFYKTQDGHLVKTKGGVSADKIANDPNFQRTRENGSEFGMAASAGKLLRTAVRNLMMTAADNRVTSRLTQLMTQIKNFDENSARGERTAGIGLTYDGGVALINGFDFNEKATLASILFKPFVVTDATGAIDFTALNPLNDVAFPSGATHVNFKSAFAVVDFTTGTSATEYSGNTTLAIENSTNDFTLLPAVVPAGVGTKFYFLLIEFLQEVNGVQYSLRNGAFNALNIVKVI